MFLKLDFRREIKTLIRNRVCKISKWKTLSTLVYGKTPKSSIKNLIFSLISSFRNSRCQFPTFFQNRATNETVSIIRLFGKKKKKKKSHGEQFKILIFSAYKTPRLMERGKRRKRFKYICIFLYIYIYIFIFIYICFFSPF